MANKSLMEKILGPSMQRPSADPDKYHTISLGDYEEVTEDAPAETYIRVAELSNLDGIPDLRKEIYDGNIVIVDISLIKRDKMILERALRDLRDVVSDVHGDIAGLGEDMVITTPTGIRIDRTRLGGQAMAY